mmetsp:Transcript_15909/g.34078  ORF Transcript_15909/g.34078 Transcript_15909/m.34078 type:complete len:216 (-) Transcript_15909:117-764(-)
MFGHAGYELSRTRRMSIAVSLSTRARSCKVGRSPTICFHTYPARSNGSGARERKHNPMRPPRSSNWRMCVSLEAAGLSMRFPLSMAPSWLLLGVCTSSGSAGEWSSVQMASSSSLYGPPTSVAISLTKVTVKARPSRRDGSSADRSAGELGVRDSASKSCSKSVRAPLPSPSRPDAPLDPGAIAGAPADSTACAAADVGSGAPVAAADACVATAE